MSLPVNCCPFSVTSTLTGSSSNARYVECWCMYTPESASARPCEGNCKKLVKSYLFPHRAARMSLLVVKKTTPKLLLVVWVSTFRVFLTSLQKNFGFFTKKLNFYKTNVRFFENVHCKKQWFWKVFWRVSCQALS